MRVIFIAKGSQGDCLPIIALASQYKRRHPQDDVVTISHASKRCLWESFDLSRDVIFIPFDNQETIVDEDDKFHSQTKWNEMVGCWEACQRQRVDAIVYTLFALEGFSIAEKLKVPSVCISPFLVNREPPIGFDKALDEEFPYLCQALRESKGEILSMAHIQHWLWRIFIDDHGRFRDEELGLSPAPYDIGDEDDSIVLPRAPLLIYCVSLPALADTVVPQLPSRVEFSGFLAAPAPTSTLIQEMESLSLFLETSIEESKPVVYVGFGSMTTLGVLKNLDDLVEHILEAAQTLKVAVLLHAQSAQDFDIYNQCARHYSSKVKVHVLARPIPHELFLSKCNVCIHHAGAGTVAASIYAESVQVCMPWFFDQFQWATRVQELGVGCKLPASDSLRAIDVSDAIHWAITDLNAQHKVKQLAQSLGTYEDNMNKTLNQIDEELSII